MVELIVSDILSRASDEHAYVMLLKERDGERKILVAIGHSEAQAIAFFIRGVKPKRPITHDLFRHFAKAFGAQMQCVTINKVDDGTFYSGMLFKMGDEMREVDARTSDAVAIALRFNAPIYIPDSLLNRVCVRDEWEGAFSVPISTANIETLRAVMDKAVKAEDYELAMKLKEEIDSREMKYNDKKEDKSNAL